MVDKDGVVNEHPTQAKVQVSYDSNLLCDVNFH